MSDRKTSSLSWVIPSMLSAAVGLAAVWQGYEVATTSQNTQKSLEISKVKLEIISSAKNYDRRSSEILFEHVLKPIDSEISYNKFRIDFLSLNSELAPASPAPAKQTQIVTQEMPQIIEQDFYSLVKEFRGDERLIASDKLVLAHNEHPEAVVNSLINGVLPEKNKWSYRVNLYIAFTLARVEPSWNGSKEQLGKIEELKEAGNFKKDSTFRRRVKEALDNYSGPKNA